MPRSRHLLPLACIAFATTMALLSQGFLEPDEITHFLYAQAAWQNPRLLLNIWARLGPTALYALAAPLGILGPRLISVAITALTAHASSLLLRQLLPPNPTSWFAKHATAMTWLLLFAQPCFALNSFTVMTEMPLACSWAWTAYILLRHRSTKGILLASFVLGLGGLMRPEGWLALAAWPLALVLLMWCRRPRRQSAGATPTPDPAESPLAEKPRVPRVYVPIDPCLMCVPPIVHPQTAPSNKTHTKNTPINLPLLTTATALSLLPVLTWYLLGALTYHTPKWFIAAWPWAPSSQYGKSGSLFLLSSLIALAAWMWLPVSLGIYSSFKSRSPQALLFFVLPVSAFFLLHGTLGTLGLFGSLSLPRYFIAVSPMLALLALMGLIHLESLLPPSLRNTLRLLTILLALAPIAALIPLGYLPMHPTTEQQRLDVIVHSLQDRHADPALLITGHPYLLLRLHLPPDSPTFTRVNNRQAFITAPIGTLVATDSTVWTYENHPSTAELTQWGYRIDESLSAAIDQIPSHFEPLVFRPDPAAKVRLWKKEK